MILTNNTSESHFKISFLIKNSFLLFYNLVTVSTTLPGLEEEELEEEEEEGAAEGEEEQQPEEES